MRFRRRRKPMVRWLQDAPPWNLASALTTNAGVIDTTAIPVTNTVSEVAMDPAASQLEEAFGLNATRVETVRDQLVADPGWRMMRCVGNFWCGLQQASTAPEGTTPTPLVLVIAAMALLETDAQGNPLAEELERHRLVPSSTAAESAGSKANRALGQSQSFLWKREWLLKNAAYDIVGSVGNSDLMILGDINGAQLQSANTRMLYNLAFRDGITCALGHTANDKIPSIHQNDYFDIKRHITVKPREALFWLIGAVGVGGTEMATSHFSLDLLIRNRMLVARPGRAPRNTR